MFRALIETENKYRIMISLSFDANFIPSLLSLLMWKKMWLLVKAQMQFVVGTECSGFGSVMFSWRQWCFVSQHPTPTEFQQELANNLPLGASENPSHLVWAAVSLAGNKFLFLFLILFFWGLLRYCFLKQWKMMIQVQSTAVLLLKYTNVKL